MARTLKGEGPVADRQVHHPLFARLWERIIAPASVSRGADSHRHKLLRGLKGRVIEVGAGHGTNFPYYPASVERVIAYRHSRACGFLSHKPMWEGCIVSLTTPARFSPRASRSVSSRSLAEKASRVFLASYLLR